MTTSLIWAEAANGVIGDRGRLPWHLPEDLALFRSLTLGSTVVMGRGTWESLPPAVRPLPGRRNVVLTRRPGWQAPGAVPARSFAEARARAPGETGEIWVIGGASVYRSLLDEADRVVRTELEDAFPGDTYAPRLGEEWRPVGRDPGEGWHRSRTGLRYRVLTYGRAHGRVAPQTGFRGRPRR